MQPYELKKQLNEEFPYRIELHAHTKPVSRCSEILPAEMVEIYAGKGYDAIVITNHFYKDCINASSKSEMINKYLSDYEETVKAAEKYNIKVFLGMELRFTENSNDYLIYGVDKDILSICYDYFDKGVETFSKEVFLENSVIVQAHPFRNGMEYCNPGLLDGIEVLNMHPGHNSRPGIAARFAYENNVPIKTVGSDFHHKNLGHEAVSALRTSVMPNTSFDIAKILKSGEYIFEIGESSLVLP